MKSKCILMVMIVAASMGVAAYRIEGFARDSETLEEMVVYRALYGEHGLWVRPAKMFFETVEREGKKMKRFELVEGAR